MVMTSTQLSHGGHTQGKTIDCKIMMQIMQAPFMTQHKVLCQDTILAEMHALQAQFTAALQVSGPISGWHDGWCHYLPDSTNIVHIQNYSLLKTISYTKVLSRWLRNQPKCSINFTQRSIYISHHENDMICTNQLIKQSCSFLIRIKILFISMVAVPLFNKFNKHSSHSQLIFIEEYL